MLILTRRLNDSFLVELEGDKLVEVKVVELTNGQVRLGISAPKSCKIWRKELYQTVEYNRQAAGGPGAGAVAGLRSLASRLSEDTGPGTNEI